MHGYFYRHIFLYSVPHSAIESSIGFILSPSSVRVYSTFGGTSGNTSLETSPFSSISRRFAVRTFWDMPDTDFFSSPKRFVPP